MGGWYSENQKVLDQLSGLKVSLQNPVFHIIFLLILLICNTGDAFDCQNRDYEISYSFVLTCHFLALIPIFINMFSIDAQYFEKTFELINMVIYVFAIFFVQDILYFDIGVNECNTLELPDCTQYYCDYKTLGNLRGVMMLEVTVFYLQILSLILWQSLEYIGLMNVEKEDDDPDQDSIETSVTTFSLLSAGFVSSIINFMVINMEGDNDTGDDPSYGWSLWMNGILNIWFTMTMYLLFTDQCEVVAACMILTLMCWLCVQIIINIVVACVNGSEYQPISFYWTIGMIPFFIIGFGKLIYRQIKLQQVESEKEEKEAFRQSATLVNDDDFKKVEGEEDKSDDGEEKVVAQKASEEIEVDRLPIGDDYYVIAFCSTLNKAKQQCPDLKPIGFLKYFYNVIFVCTMQLTLLFLVSLELYYSSIYACHFFILTARFLCAVLLHMTIEPEVRQAILMYRYFVNHTTSFDDEQKIVDEVKEKNYAPEKAQVIIEERIMKEVYKDEIVDDDKDDVCPESGEPTVRYSELPEWMDGDLGEGFECDTEGCPNMIGIKQHFFRGCEKSKKMWCIPCVKARLQKAELEEKKHDLIESKAEVEALIAKKIEENDGDVEWTQDMFNREKPKYTFMTYYPAMFIPLLQLITALFTEGVSLFLIANSMTVMDVVMNFVALAIIADIDNMFSDASQDPHMKKYIEENEDEFRPLLISSGIQYGERSCRNKCQYFLYKLLDFNHVVWYFYFFPFLSVILNFYVAGAENCENLEEDTCSRSPFGIVE